MTTRTKAPKAAAADTAFFQMDDDHVHEPGGATLLGFWIYLMSDALLFAAIFATFGVLGTSYAGGPTAREISTCRSSRSIPQSCWCRRSPTDSPCCRWNAMR